MIGFFRKMRKKLADDNQFFKYSRYAIGEILLVVIGILIALSINNWNEDKKVMKYELKILQELYSTIINDIEFQKIQIEENESAIASAEIIIKSFNESFSYSDSLNFHFDNWRSICDESSSFRTRCFVSLTMMGQLAIGHLIGRGG